MSTTNKPAAGLQEHIDIHHWAEQMSAAKTAAEPFPRVTDVHADLNLATAYAIQNAFVDLRVQQGATISGYKAALTAPAAQAAMGIDTPIVGTLLAEGCWEQDQGSASVSLQQIPKLILETELGFQLNQEVSKPIASIEQMESLIQSCHPMIEFACLGFDGPSPTGCDLIAGNSASRSYLQGASWAWSAANLDALSVQLKRDGEELHQTLSGSVLGGQLQALLWLVNTTIENGRSVAAGQILMTGSIGGLHPAQPGQHQASYGAAGTLRLEVTDR